MTGKQRLTSQLIWEACEDIYGPSLDHVVASPITSPESTLFPVTVYFGPEELELSKVWRSLADLQDAAKRSLPR